jgi:NCS1 family nucleobase:cation symporter-1
MAIIMGTLGFVVAAVGVDNIDSYEAFLLVIAYWIGPWLGVVFADRILRRVRPRETVTSNPRYRNWAGFIAMLAAAAISIWLFSNQAKYVGMIPKAFPAIGDLTFEVGFVLAFTLYAALYRPLADPITVCSEIRDPSAERSPAAEL